MLTWCVEAREGWDEQLVVDAFEAWAALGECTSLELERVDCADADVHVGLGDPGDAADDGVLFVQDADGFVVNDVDWAVDEESCEDELPLLPTVLLHLVGDALGVPHTCDEGDTCSDEAAAAAVMYWNNPPCLSRSLNVADFEALASVYGPASVEAPASKAVSAVVGEETCLDLDVTGDPAKLEIGVDWGDGAVGGDVCHVYDAEGAYYVDLAYAWDISCGDVARLWDPWVIVTACDVPHAEDGAGGFFSWTVAGNVATFSNHLDRGTYGCVDTLQWTAYAGDTAVYTSNAWAPTVDFGAPGTYRMVLNAGGPGGVAAHEAEVTVGESGCATVAGGPWWLAALLLARRRRA
ncbi:MAG: hypothetical protein ACOZNI_33305 [Myxococcota bacterium]